MLGMRLHNGRRYSSGMEDWIEKWDGKLPTYMTGANTTMMLPAQAK